MEKKRNGIGVTIVPEIGGQVGKVPYRKGWILCRKARKRSVSFPERGCIILSRDREYAYRYTPLNLLE